MLSEMVRHRGCENWTLIHSGTCGFVSLSVSHLTVPQVPPAWGPTYACRLCRRGSSFKRTNKGLITLRLYDDVYVHPFPARPYLDFVCTPCHECPPIDLTKPLAAQLKRLGDYTARRMGRTKFPSILRFH